MEDIFSKWSIYIKKIILTINYSPQRNPVKHNSKNEWKRAKFKCVHDVIEAWPSNLIEKTRWMVYTFKLFPLCWIIKIHIDLAGWILEKKRIVCKLCIVNNIDKFECKKKVFLLQNLIWLKFFRPDSIYQHYQRYLEEQFTVNYQNFSTTILMICYRRF